MESVISQGPIVTKTGEAGTSDEVDGGRLPWALIAVTGTEGEPPQDEDDRPL